MRLLNARTLEFAEFICEDETPKYARLSHTWEEEEVTFKEMRKHRDQAESKKGFRKIKLCADQAVKDGLDYFWIDTCCIDKSSSAELSEAINSMFRWYQKSEVCYAFLSDIIFSPAKDEQEIAKCRWFTRGWTLQELLAPSRVEFFSGEWRPLGDKFDLLNLLNTITRIPRIVLNSGDCSQCSIAQRMSWAANRQTSRVEDAAYCLLGLFDINMPLLYGEGGEKAFIRLQQEIIKESDDMSIFAWEDSSATWYTYRGLLAYSVLNFASCGQILWMPVNIESTPRFKYTNKGLKIKLPHKKVEGLDHDEHEYLAILPGVISEHAWDGGKVAIYLTYTGQGQYARTRPTKLVRITAAEPKDRTTREIDPAFYIRQQIRLTGTAVLSHSRAGGLRLYLPKHFNILSIEPKVKWNEEQMLMSFDEGSAHPIVNVNLYSPDTGNISFVVDVNQEWVSGKGAEVLPLGAERSRVPRMAVLTVYAKLITSYVYVKTEVITCRLTVLHLNKIKTQSSLNIYLFRGLFMDRWIFRLRVEARQVPVYRTPIRRKSI